MTAKQTPLISKRTLTASELEVEPCSMLAGKASELGAAMTDHLDIAPITFSVASYTAVVRYG